MQNSGRQSAWPKSLLRRFKNRNICHIFHTICITGKILIKIWAHLDSFQFTVDARYHQDLLSRTFTISNFLTGPLNFSSNYRLKNIRYLELRYLKPII